MQKHSIRQPVALSKAANDTTQQPVALGEAVSESPLPQMSGTEGSWGACWVLVTGASRGLGAAICEGVAPLLGEGSRLVGVARTAGGLANTEGQVKKAGAKVQVSCLAG